MSQAGTVALRRTSLSLRNSATGLYRIASLLAATPSRSHSPLLSRTCLRCHAPALSQQRPLSTATEFKPYTLEPSPPPPGSPKLPSKSLGGANPTPNETRPPDTSKQDTFTSQISQNQPEVASLSLPGSMAPKAAPAVDAPPPSKRTSKLRPRKAAMTLTPGATTQLRGLLDSPDPKYIRVGVKNRGCSGLAYHLEYVDKPGSFDETVEQDGVKVLVDSKALFSIIGSEMDWVEDKLEQKFVFRNPNIKEQCGCGESFMV